MSKFEIIKEYADKDITIPTRATEKSAGYDIYAAEDCVIPSYLRKLFACSAFDNSQPYNLNNHAEMVIKDDLKPVMVKTGIKAQLQWNEELELRSRSSISTKNLLMLANGVGTIDADYYNNEANEGHIMIPLLNFSPYDVKISKGERIAQALIKEYKTTEDDAASGIREGGFGSSGN